VLDELAEIPVCVAYKINGKKTDNIPADVATYDKIECIYENLPGWQKSTEGLTDFDKLPKKAQSYLKFLEQQSGGRIGMVSTGPDRDQTMFIEGFAAVVGM
jgi:adenylosuccinate synthase